MKLRSNNLLGEVFFLLGVTLFSLLTFAIMRTLLIIRNSELLDGIPNLDILNTYLVGIRFDLIVVSYILIPLCLCHKIYFKINIIQ